MKTLTRKIFIATFCVLGVVSVSTTADAQKRKAKSTKARTSVKAKTAYKRVPQDTQVNTLAQNNTSTSKTADALPPNQALPADGYEKNEMYTNAKAFNYPGINSRDVKFYKRVWRDIDVNDPKNSLFNTPGATLADIVLEGLRTGKLTAYEPSATNSDSTFARPLTLGKALSKLQDSVMVDQFDQNGNKIGSKMVLNDFNAARVTKFRTKEDIYFDKKRSMIVTRIVGLAPLMSAQVAGATVGETPAFWLYFPQCRDFFATKDVTDPDRNIYDTTIDDLFVQGKYASAIVRASGNDIRPNTQLANNAIAGSVIDPAAAEKDKAEVSKLVESKIDNFKNSTWDYKLKASPKSDADKRDAMAAERKQKKEAAAAEKKTKKPADKGAKLASNQTDTE